MLKKLKNKISGHYGETLVETLVGLLIVSLCFVMLAGAIVAAAKANNAIQNTDTAYVYDLDDLEKQTDHDGNSKGKTVADGQIIITHADTVTAVMASPEPTTTPDVNYYIMSVDKPGEDKTDFEYIYYSEPIEE